MEEKRWRDVVALADGCCAGLSNPYDARSAAISARWVERPDGCREGGVFCCEVGAFISRLCDGGFGFSQRRDVEM